MANSLSSSNRTAFDVVNIVAGLGLLLSPWYLGFTNEAYAAWNAWIVGAAVAVIAAAALFAFHEAEEGSIWWLASGPCSRPGCSASQQLRSRCGRM